MTPCEQHFPAMIHVLNLYLEPERAVEVEKVKALATSTDEKSTEQLEGYVREALRTCLYLTSLLKELKPV
jgi:hypothetical protein